MAVTDMSQYRSAGCRAPVRTRTLDEGAQDLAGKCLNGLAACRALFFHTDGRQLEGSRAVVPIATTAAAIGRGSAQAQDEDTARLDLIDDNLRLAGAASLVVAHSSCRTLLSRADVLCSCRRGRRPQRPAPADPPLLCRGLTVFKAERPGPSPGCTASPTGASGPNRT